ncbi:MAG: hypothetical protein AAFV45_01265 [Pseudomonadota bacterium]
MTHPDRKDAIGTKQTQTSGWIEAGLFVLAISTLNIVYGVAEQAGAHVVVFVLYATTFAALGMLLVSGLGKDWRAVIAAPQSWIFGIATIAMEIFYYLLIAATTPTEASLLMRFAVPVSIIMGSVVMARSINRLTLIGSAIVIASVLPVFLGVSDANIGSAIALTSICALIVATKTFASEFHPWNQAADTIKEKLRVTGLVVLTTGAVGVMALIPVIIAVETGALSEGGLAPNVADVLNPATIILAIVLGAPILFAMNYLTFSSVVKISTEGFIAMTAFTPFTTLTLQLIAVSLGAMIAPDFPLWLVPPAILGLVGVIIIIRARSR